MTRFLPRHSFVLALAFVPLACSAAGAATLAPHRAVYDLSLSSQTDDLIAASARIALELTAQSCDAFDLSYRFVARFAQNEETVVTDQRTTSREDLVRRTFEFNTQTFADGIPERQIEGSASSSAETTSVTMQRPQQRKFQLPLSIFPLQHTAQLIEKAQAGETIVETALFDGDDEAEKLLTSTALIGPSHDKETGEVEPGTPDTSADPAGKLAGLKSWQIFESYYNSDSNADGLPVFRTSYVLYENGVSDELVLDYGTYAFEGGLSQLDLLDAPKCD